MFDKNSISTGLIVGILIPLIAFPVLYGLFTGLEALAFASDEGFRPLFKERTSALVAIGFNAIALNFYQKRRYDESMRGIVFPTFIFVGIWMYLFKDLIL